MLKLTPTSLFIHVRAVTPGGKNGKNINIFWFRVGPLSPRAVAVAVRAGRSVGESPGQPWQVLDPND